MTTPLQKAAQGAAEEWAANYSGLASGILEKIILKHLAPVQTELDEARGLIESPSLLARHQYEDVETYQCSPDCARCKAQSWLARNPVKKG